MPLPLSSIAIDEKNKIATSDSVFLLAMKIEIPGMATPIRVVANTEDITWQGETWQAFPFEINEISEADSGEVPRVDVRVSNVSREIEYYLHAYDLYCKTNGYEPIVCTIYVLNSLNLASDTPEVDHLFELIQPKTTPQWATFTLGASNPWTRRFPARRLLPMCQWVFKSDACGYSGTETECDKTLSRCRELSNSERFGGFYVTGF